MNDLLKKLNTLTRAKLNDLTPSLPSFERAPNLDRQVEELRSRINEALEYEDQLQATAQSLRDEVVRLDSLADDAVAQGRDADARYLLDQLKRAEQRLSFAEADLRAHQRSAEELIRRVNMLEATVADAKAGNQSDIPAYSPPPTVPPQTVERAAPLTAPLTAPPPPVQKQAAPTPPPVQNQTATPTQAASTPSEEQEYQSPAERFAAPAREAAQEQAEKTQTAVEKISGMLREAQEKTQSRIESLGEMLNAGLGTDAASPTPPAPAPDPQSDNSVMMPRPKKTDDDDDLAQRLRRLSKPE